MNNPNLVFLLSLLFILLGYLLKRIRLLNEADGGTISKIILNVTLPALILRTISGAEIIPSLAFLPLAALLYGGMMAGLLLVFNRRRDAESKAILAMGAIGFNNGMFAYPIVEGIFGLTGLQYLALFDIGSGLSVFGLSYMIAAYYSARRGNADFRMTPALFLKMIIGSIPFVSYLLALVINLAGVRITGFADTVLAVPARANMVLVLILIGQHLEFGLKGADRGKVAQIFGLRYGVGILLSLMILALPIHDPVLRGVLAVLFILPVSMAIIPYSAKFGFERSTGGVLVNYSIIISFLLMWLIVNLVT